MLKKVSIISIFAFALFCFIVNPALAQNPFAGKPKGLSGQAGVSNIGLLNLFQKDSITWEIVEDGAWGKMKYNLSGELFDFVFNGHQLESGSTYALIYYPNPWPGDGLICLGVGMADEYGDVHIQGKMATGDLPAAGDEGAKIWLVLESDVECGNDSGNPQMIGWNPDRYLFEYNLITFVATDE